MTRSKLDAVSLHWLANRSGPVTAKQLEQIQHWIDVDWESHDVNRDAVRLIQRLITALKKSPDVPPAHRVMCHSCDKRRIKYVDGLCESCHKIATADWTD
jgi:hypothetical protein